MCCLRARRVSKVPRWGCSQALVIIACLGDHAQVLSGSGWVAVDVSRLAWRLREQVRSAQPVGAVLVFVSPLARCGSVPCWGCVRTEVLARSLARFATPPAREPTGELYSGWEPRGEMAVANQYGEE